MDNGEGDSEHSVENVKGFGHIDVLQMISQC